MLNRLIAATALALGLLAAAPVAASADDAVNGNALLDECVARHPGAVREDAAMTDGADLVCVLTRPTPSAGDDTYLWLDGANDLPGVTLHYDGSTDPGTDTLSLADWTTPLREDYAAGTGLLWGQNEVWGVDAYTLTGGDDVLGNPDHCARLTASSTTVFNTGEGADTVNCITGVINTQGGDDTVVGVTLDTVVNTGEGNDVVTGDADADEIVLGAGDDIAEVEDVVGSVVDVVDGGEGDDVVYADPTDRVFSARMLSRVEPTAPSVTEPTTTTKRECTTKRVHKRVWNKRHTHRVHRWVKVRRCHTVTVTP